MCIGSGFATGQELLQFFSSHGLNSIYIGLICAILMSYCGAKLLVIGKNKRFKTSNDIFTYLFGKHIGGFFKILMPVFCLCSFVVMVSGAGAAMNEYYGMSKTIGGILLATITLISVMLGIEKVIKILGNIGPVIIVITIVISVVTLSKNHQNLHNINSIVESLNMTKALSNWSISGIVYSGLNIIFVTPFLVEAGKNAKSLKSCKYGGIVGGLVFVITAFIINLSMLSNIKKIYINEIPTLFMARQMGSSVGIIFSIILMLGIYTTAVPLLLNVCSSCAKEKSIEFNIIAVLSTILAVFGGMLPFSYLVNFMYPISGTIGVMIIIMTIYKSIKKGN